MKLGFGIPHAGPAAGPESIVQVAQRAEELGYDSLWVSDRLLYPLEPESAYAGRFKPWPEVYKSVVDPLHALTYAAANTSNIRLGTSVLVTGYYNPVALARQLTAIDVLSGGRLQVGLGAGWAKDEHDVTGVEMSTRGARTDEFIDVLKTIWTDDPVQYSGEFFNIPEAAINLKPVQDPHPPLYVGGVSSVAVRRAATLADGWNPVGFLPAPVLGQQINQLRQMAQNAGRSGDNAIKIVMRVNFTLTGEPANEEERRAFNGSAEQIRADIAAHRELEIDEIFFDPTFSPQGASVEGFLETMETIKELAG